MDTESKTPCDIWEGRDSIIPLDGILFVKKISLTELIVFLKGVIPQAYPSVQGEEINSFLKKYYDYRGNEYGKKSR